MEKTFGARNARQVKLDYRTRKFTESEKTKALSIPMKCVQKIDQKKINSNQIFRIINHFLEKILNVEGISNRTTVTQYEVIFAVVHGNAKF